MTATKKGKPVKKVEFTPQPPIESSIVSIGCGQGQGEVPKLVKIFNNTDRAVPAGSTIKWEANNGDKGSITLSVPLAPGAGFNVQGQTEQNDFVCKAWYRRPPSEIVAKRKIKAGG